MEFSTLSVLFAASDVRRKAWLAYGLAVVFFLLALAARFALTGYLGLGFPFLTFFPAIVLATLLGGRGPGSLCVALSLTSAWFWFVGGPNSFKLDAQAMVALAFFAVVAALDVWVIDVMTRALDRVESMRLETAAMVVQRTTLFQELQHRVANNLMTVATALAVEEHRLKHLPEAVESFKKVRLRFEMLSHIHRKLHDPENAEVEFGPYLQALCDGFLKASERPNIRCIVDSCHVAFDADRTVTLSLLALEIVTNSLKHAFVDGESGTISLRLAKSTKQPSHLVLTVRDNGRGLQPGFDFTKGGRLGVGILKGFARALMGEITVSSASPEKGTIVRLIFPYLLPVLPETVAAPVGLVTERAELPVV